MCHLSQTPTGTATETPPAKSPTMLSRMVHKDQNSDTTDLLSLFCEESFCN